MTDLVENSADLRVEHLTKLLKHKETFQNAPLSAYLRDIGRLLEETHESRVKVTCHVTSTCYDLTVDGLPDISSHIKRYVKVDIEPVVPELEHVISDSHVITLPTNETPIKITIEPPDTVISMSYLTVSIIYDVPEVIRSQLGKDRFIKVIHGSRVSRPVPHLTTRTLPPIIEQFTLSRGISRDIVPAGEYRAISLQSTMSELMEAYDKECSNI